MFLIKIKQYKRQLRIPNPLEASPEGSKAKRYE